MSSILIGGTKKHQTLFNSPTNKSPYHFYIRLVSHLLSKRPHLV